MKRKKIIKKAQAIPQLPLTYHEPEKHIKGGTFRESTRVSTEKIPSMVKRRIVLDSILSNHCASSSFINELLPTDEPILQLMACETIVTGAHPIIRKKAISALQQYDSSKTINILTDLSENGEDEFVRSTAITALAKKNLKVSLPIFIEGLTDSSNMVRDASIQAMQLNRAVLGELELTPYLDGIKNRTVKTLMSDIISGKLKKVPFKRKVVKKDS